MSWGVFERDDTVEIVPLRDIREHFFGMKCWCQPRRDEKDPSVIVHNSADGRELYEQRPAHG